LQRKWSAKNGSLSDNSQSKPCLNERQSHSGEEVDTFCKFGAFIEYMVLFYGSDDPTNPQSFSFKKKRQF
jgi:hypothetical protein